jgi:hypothetical protein
MQVVISLQRHLKKDIELLGEIDTDTSMDAALLVVEAGMWYEWKYALMPYTGMDIKTCSAIEVKGDKPIGCHIISRQCERSNKRRAIQWKEQLATIRVIVSMP